MSSAETALLFDVGTTGISGALRDIAAGRRIAFASAPNPNRSFGADVTTRLEKGTKDPAALRQMSEDLQRSLYDLARRIADEAGVPLCSVTSVLFAANPAVSHILLGLPLERLAYPPYRPLFHERRLVSTRDLGWTEDISASVFPLPGGYVGGDLVAFLCGVEAPVPSLFIDVGTNTEIAVSTHAGFLATSAASGPAFEGGNLSCGMQAVSGAVISAALSAGRLNLTTVDSAPPAGIAGSGFMSIVALLLEEGVLAPDGRLDAVSGSVLSSKMTERNGEPVFVLYRDARGEVVITQEDIRNFQLAKAAVRGALEVLLEHEGLAEAAVREVVVTGAFGTGILPEDLKRVGILPPKMVEVTRFAPEGVIAGMEKAVASGFTAVDSLAASIRVIPLSGTPAFQKHFLAQLDFPASAPH